MPRKVRKQPGASGGAYANRTDLTQPVAVPTGLPYGEGQALAQAQQQAPLPKQAPAVTPSTVRAPAQGQGMDPAVLAAMMHNGPDPGQSLAAPTQRPYEPIQHGLPTGPGGGPEVLGQANTTAQMLQALAQQTGNPTIQIMANRARQFDV